MVAITTHPADVQDSTRHEATMFASSSVCTNLDTRRQDNHLDDDAMPEDHLKSQGGEQESDELPELVAADSASEDRHTPESPDVQYEPRAGHAFSADSKDDQMSSAVKTGPFDDIVRQPAHVSSDIDDEKQTRDDAASPASSSADALGSDYDDYNPYESLKYVNMQTRANERLAALATPKLLAVPGRPLAPISGIRNDENNAQVINVSAADWKAEPITVQLEGAPTQVEAEQELSNLTAKEGQGVGDLGLVVETLVSRIDCETAMAQEHVMADKMVQEDTGEALTAPLLLAAEADGTAQPFPSTIPLIRNADDVQPCNRSKRPKLKDAVSVAETPAEVDTDTVSKKKARAKPKAPSKPKKEPKAKGKKAAAERNPQQEVIQPEVCRALDEGHLKEAQEDGCHDTGRIPDPVNAPSDEDVEAKPKIMRKAPTRSLKQTARANSEGGSSQNNVSLDAAAPVPDHEAASMQKKARKAPVRSRKQLANAAVDVQEAWPHPEQVAMDSDSSVTAPIEALLVQASSAPELHPQEHAPALPVPTGKGKAKATRKAPKKAKSTVKADAAEAVEAAGANAVVSEADADTLSAPSLAPCKKLTPKRTSPKNGKGRLAQLRPAQTDGAVSDLDLDANNKSPSILTLPAPGARLHDGKAWSQLESSHTAAEIARYASSPQQGYCSNEGLQRGEDVRPPVSAAYASGYSASNIFTSMPPPHYPAQAYWPTRGEVVQEQNRGLSSLTSAASLVEAEMRWTPAASTLVPGSTTSAAHDEVDENGSPATIAYTAGSGAGDEVSDTASNFQAEPCYRWEHDPRIYPQGWKLPVFGVIDPNLLMTSFRDTTVWTFWDCYLPLGCRDQDMVLMSNDSVAFPCAAWNPCLFSVMLKRVIRNPNRVVAQILQSGVEENRKRLGYKPLPCVWIDEDWRATNMLLSFLHPIPSMYLPDRHTCCLVKDLGLRYGVERAITTATQRLGQLSEETRAAANDKGKGRAREEEIAADLAERGTAG